MSFRMYNICESNTICIYKKLAIFTCIWQKKLNTLIIYLGKQVKESCKIKGDNEITDDAKKETNKYNMSGVCQVIFWVVSRIFCHTGKYLSNTEERRLRYAE